MSKELSTTLEFIGSTSVRMIKVIERMFWKKNPKKKLQIIRTLIDRARLIIKENKL
jgi:hypothetical protein